MNTNLYRVAGIAAIALAVFFPLYWLNAFTDLTIEALREDFLTFTGWDVLFILIGVLEVFVYFALARLFRDQLSGALPAVLLTIMAVLVAGFHSTVIVDVLLVLGVGTAATDTIITAAVVFSLICLFLYTFVSFILAIVLLTRFGELSVLIRIFTVGLLLACVFQASILLSIINTFLFPILMVILAVYFLRGEHTVDVV